MGGIYCGFAFFASASSFSVLKYRDAFSSLQDFLKDIDSLMEAARTAFRSEFG